MTAAAAAALYPIYSKIFDVPHCPPPRPKSRERHLPPPSPLDLDVPGPKAPVACWRPILQGSSQKSPNGALSLAPTTGDGPPPERAQRPPFLPSPCALPPFPRTPECFASPGRSSLSVGQPDSNQARQLSDRPPAQSASGRPLCLSSGLSSLCRLCSLCSLSRAGARDIDVLGTRSRVAASFRRILASLFPAWPWLFPHLHTHLLLPLLAELLSCWAAAAARRRLELRFLRQSPLDPQNISKAPLRRHC
jgi:hypothetical protein